MTGKEKSFSLTEVLNAEKSDILQAMDSSINASSQSINPFFKGSKLRQLNDLKAAFEVNPTAENLIAFLKKSSEGRPPFFSRPNSAKALQGYSFKNNFLLEVINHIFNLLNSKTEIKVDTINSSFNTTDLNQAGIQQSFQKSTEQGYTSDDTVALSVESSSDESEEEEEVHISSQKTPSKNGSNRPKPKGRRVEQAEDPLRTVESEDIIALADMGRKIKLIQRDLVREMMNKRFGGDSKPKKKKVESTEQEATPEQLGKLQNILKVSFSGDQEELTSIDNAAKEINSQELAGLSYNQDLGIAKWQYNRIQSRAKEFRIIKSAHESALPKDEGYLARMLDIIKTHYPSLNVLTFSEENYPIIRSEFEKLVEQSLSDAEKINNICAEILSENIADLFGKINNGYFMSRPNGIKRDDFLEAFKSKLGVINWGFKRLIDERESLEADGLKLKLALVENYLSSAPESVVEEEVNKIPNRPKPAFLSGIEGKGKGVSSTSSPKLESAGAPKTQPQTNNPASSFAAKQAMLGLTMGAKTPGSRPASPPSDLSGKNKIKVKSTNLNFLNLISSYLRGRYEFEQKSILEGSEFIIKGPVTAFNSVEEIKQAQRDFAQHLIDHGYAPVYEIIYLDSYNPAFKEQLNSQSLKVKFNPNYISKREDFEQILNSENVLFFRAEDTYIINQSCWTPELLTKLAQAKFTDDCFNLVDRRLKTETDRVLARSVEVVKFSLNIPNPALQAKFIELFNRSFAGDTESFLDAERYMVIRKDNLEQFRGFLKRLHQQHIDIFSGEYIQTENEDFAAIIKDELHHRLRISVNTGKDNVEAQSLFTNPLNTRVEGNDELIYYVDVSTLTGKKEQFFNLAARSEFNIDYYDPEINQYQSIEYANDSQFKNASPDIKTSQQGLFAERGRDSNLDDHSPTDAPTYD